MASIASLPVESRTAPLIVASCTSNPIYLASFIRVLLPVGKDANDQTYSKGAPLSHGPKISRYEARRAIFFSRHDLQDYGKFIESESGAIKKGGAPAPRRKDRSRSEDAVKDAERGTSGAPRSGLCSLTAVRAEATTVKSPPKGALL